MQAFVLRLSSFVGETHHLKKTSSFLDKHAISFASARAHFSIRAISCTIKQILQILMLRLTRRLIVKIPFAQMRMSAAAMMLVIALPILAACGGSPEAAAPTPALPTAAVGTNQRPMPPPPRRPPARPMPPPPPGHQRARCHRRAHRHELAQAKSRIWYCQPSVLHRPRARADA